MKNSNELEEIRLDQETDLKSVRTVNVLGVQVPPPPLYLSDVGYQDLPVTQIFASSILVR